MNSFPGEIIGIDPGLMNGIATFYGDGRPKGLGQLTLDEMVEWADSYEPEVSVLVVEDFVTFKKRALQQAGSRQHASQVIGLMKGFAKRKKAHLVLQPASILDTAVKWSQVKMPSDHSISHQISAYNHAYYWMVNAGVIETKLVKEISGEH